MQTDIRSIVLYVSDLGRALQFYQEGLEMKTLSRSDEDHIAVVDAGGAELWLYSGIPDAKWLDYPVCIFNVGDVEEARERVVANGGEITSKLTKDGLGSYYIFKDTEGNSGEIRQPPARK